MEQSICERTQEIERLTLSPYAVLSENTRGRDRAETPCDIRTPFQRDRDRIIHCTSFLRLKHKTQVFLSPEGDHYRTRLTHTLEVSQIARTIARGLRLNEDLTEAIALGHDLGHTPFGHAGERALNEVYPNGFHHYEQSVRVVEQIERDGKGLNLTKEVRNGILCHTRGEEAYTLEGQAVKYADRIAYINHDIEDAIRAGVLSADDIPKDIVKTLGDGKSKRIDTLVRSLLYNSHEKLEMCDCIQQAFDELHTFMFSHVYTNPVCKGEEGKAIAIVQSLYCYFKDHADELPGVYADIRDREGENRAACDYIAGMTDGYALKTYSRLFIPNSWSKF